MKIRPATFEDVLAIASSPLAKVVFYRLAALVRNGAFVATADDGAMLVAIGGLYRYPDGSAREAWIRIEPGSWSRLRPLLLAIRPRLVELAAAGPPIVARITAGNRRGARLAERLGFEATGQLSAGQPLWRFQG